MVSATKYYIYGGGRWREVDATTGCIEGWGRARFLVARRGQLEAVRSGPVLGALRALAESKPSAARDGPLLPFKYPKEKQAHNKVKERGLQTSCQHCQHCKHCNQTNVNSGSTSFKTSLSNKNQETALQNKKEEASIPTTLLFRDTPGRKRKRKSTSPDQSNPKIMTVATAQKTEHKPPNRLVEWKESETKQSKNTKISVEKSKRLKTSNSEDDNVVLADVKSSLKKPEKDLHKSRPLKRKRDSSKQSSSTPGKAARLDDENKITNHIKTKSRSDKKPSNSRPSPKNRINHNRTSSELGSDRQESKPKDVIKRKPNEGLVISSETDPKAAKPHSRKTPHQKPAPKRIPGPVSSQPNEDKGQVETKAHTIRELIIDERDVQILRLYIQRNHSSGELFKFDTSNQYKISHFYQINPLVNIERCPRIDRMLRSGSQHSRAPKQDIASTVRLRTASESEPRFRTRKRKDRSSVDKQTSGSEDKENLDKDKKHLRTEEVRHTVKNSRSREVELSEKVSNKETRSGTERDRHTSNDEAAEGIRDINENIDSKATKKKGMNSRGKNTKERDNTKDTGNFSAGGEQFVEKAVVKKPVLKNPKVTSTKRRVPREYSTLEDHAIVSWVSTGGRASSVNGNRLWGELQEQFPRLTGQVRSWHSLRNRYLRYILPRLGSLALPAAQQSRLRAAAATGELKKGKAKARRNSIFALPPRGASSRARALLSTPAARSRTPSPTPSPATRARSADTRHPTLHETAKEPPKQGKGRRTASSPPSKAPSRRGAAPSPRYSEVTRQFANKRRARPSTDTTSQHSDQHTNRRKSPVKKDTDSNKNRKIKEASPEGSDAYNESGDSSDSSTRSSPAWSTNRSGRLSRGSGKSRGKSNRTESRTSLRLKEIARRSATNSPRSQSQRRSLRLKSIDLPKMYSEDLVESPVSETKHRSLIDTKKPSRTRKLFNPKVVS